MYPDHRWIHQDENPIFIEKEAVPLKNVLLKSGNPPYTHEFRLNDCFVLTSQLCWLECGVNNTKVAGLIPVGAICLSPWGSHLD